MNPLYNTGIRLYRFGASVKARSDAKVRRMVEGQRQTLARIREKLGEGSGCVWFHAASLGEFEQARPMIERLRREHPERKILLTFFSPSGYDVRCNYPMVDCVAYLPFDTPKNVSRFLDAAAPSMAIFVKYEFWGNYLQQLQQRGIPTYIISAIFRKKQIFFRWYGGMFRRMLGRFNTLYLQDEASRQLLENIGVSNTVVAGDTRFDRVTDIMATTFSVAGMDDFNPFVIFGSSWPADEEHYAKWLRDNPQVRFIIAPHEFDDARIEALCHIAPGRIVTLSQWEKGVADGEIDAETTDIRGIVVDSFGKLSSLYRYASIAYVGGGFGVGIHNINEAAVYGIPVVIGPNYGKFREARDLTALGGAFSVADTDAAYRVLSQMHDDDDARRRAGDIAADYIRRNIGATDRIYSDLFK